MNTTNTTNLIYENCKVLSPDGILMFRCRLKKINWYLNRNLATLIEQEPLTIQLTFNPNGLGNHGKDYGLEHMNNKCINCGISDHLTRHHIVPICYRKFFPLEIKSHNFHDVLPMCISCHNKYERKADKLKLELSKVYNVKINGLIENDKELNKHINLAIALLKIKNIPKNRITEIRKTIKDFFKIKRLTKSRLRKISEMKTKPIIKTHGEVIVSKLTDINGFIKIWRDHFIQNNECVYLPENWRK